VGSPFVALTASLSRSGNNSFSNADTALLMAPLGFARAGRYYYNNGGLDSQSSYGLYWSHRIHSSANSYDLYFNSGYVGPQDSSYRGRGFSVRCLARLYKREKCDIMASMITKENKDKAIAKVARNKADVGSPEVQVSILTERIKEVTEHVKNNKHDFMAKRGLMQMVGKRKKLLKYLENTNFELYKETVQKLGLRK